MLIEDYDNKGDLKKAIQNARRKYLCKNLTPSVSVKNKFQNAFHKALIVTIQSKILINSSLVMEMMYKDR